MIKTSLLGISLSNFTPLTQLLHFLKVSGVIVLDYESRIIASLVFLFTLEN